MKRILLFVTMFILAAAFMGCHKNPLDYGNVGVLNLNLQRGYKTMNKGALESFYARVTIYYSENDTISYNCRFVDTDGDGLYNNDPSALDCIYVRREVGFWVGVQAVIQGDNVAGMSDPTNLLYLSDENPVIDVTIVLEAGYPRIVLNANPVFDGETFLLYGEVLEGMDQIEPYGFLMRPGQLTDEEKRFWSKRVLTRLDFEELLEYADYMGFEITDSYANKFVGRIDMGELGEEEYSVVAIAMLRMNDNDTIEKVIHSSFATMKFSLDGVYIDEPYYSGDTVTLYAYYAGSSQVNECGFVLGFSENELTDTMPCRQTDAIFSLTLFDLQPNTTYYYKAYVKTADGLVESEIGQFRLTMEPSEPTGYMGGYGYVDLGLPSGTLWAYTNIGATNPEDLGEHYAWGETTANNDYQSTSWNTYRYCNGSETTLTKYCNDSAYGYEGYTDTLTTLEASDDAATVNWGNNWRMPTLDEFQELIDNCTWTWITINNINGYLITGNNDNSIFMPADVSWGYYLPCVFFADIPSYVRILYFTTDVYTTSTADPRYECFSVRPVCIPSKKKRK